MKCFETIMNMINLDIAVLTIGFKSIASLSDYCALLLGFDVSIDYYD